MANKHRGEVELTAGDEIYTLLFSVNALCDLEEHFDMPIGRVSDMLNDPNNVRLTDLRALLLFALKEHHPDLVFTDAGRIATDAGIPETMAKLGQAFVAAFPEEKKGGNPPAPKGRGSARSRS